MSEQAYTEHRYGTHGGATKVKPARSGGQEKYRSTESAMSDKMRYNVTRFEGEQNTVHCDNGEETTDYRAAYEYVKEAAQRIADEKTTGRYKHQSYIYDTTMSPGGRFSDEQAAHMVQAYKEDLQSRGIRVEGMTYVIHQNTQNTHVHMMYATDKTLQRTDNAQNKVQMAREADKLRTPEQAREWKEQQQQAQQKEARTREDHDDTRSSRGR